jgi:hypothetical protein
MFREDNDEYEDKPVVQRPDNMFHRIAKADNATLKKAQDLLAFYGIRRASNRADLYMKLVSLYKAKRDEVIPKLIEIHPDRMIFENYYTDILKQNQSDADKKHSDELSKIKKNYDDQIRDIKMDLRFAGISGGQWYNDSGAAPQQASHTSDIVKVGALIGVIGIVGVMVIVASK